MVVVGVGGGGEGGCRWFHWEKKKGELLIHYEE